MFWTRKWFVFFIGSLCCAAATSLQAQDSIDLRPKFDPNSSDYLEVDLKVQNKWDASTYSPAKTESYEWLRGVTRSFNPPTGEDRYTIPLTFDRVTFLGKTPSSAPVDYDSDTDDPDQPANPAAAIGRLMLDKFFVLLVTDGGRGGGVAGLRHIYKDIEEQQANDPLFETLMEYFSEDAERFTWSHFPYALYAYAEVKAGDTWSVPLRRFDLFLGESEYQLKCRLIGISEKNKRKIATISFSADITPADKGREGIYMRTLKLNVKSGKLEGTAEYDVQRHEIVKQHSQTTLNIVATNAGKDRKGEETFGIQRTIDETRRLLTEDERRTESRIRRKGK